MRIRNLLACAAAGASLLGCSMFDPAGYPGPRAGPPCNDPVCHVKVTATAGCRIKAEPYEIHVARGNRNSQVHFDLTHSPGFAFRSDGVFLKKPPNDDLTPEFVNATLFKVKNKNTTHATHEYGIRLTENGNPCPDYDPAIVNDM